MFSGVGVWAKTIEGGFGVTAPGPVGAQSVLRVRPLPRAGRYVSEFQRHLDSYGGSGELKCVVQEVAFRQRAGTPLEQAAAASVGRRGFAHGDYHILCGERVLVIVPAAAAWSTLTPKGTPRPGATSVVATVQKYQFEPDGHFDPMLRGKINQIPKGGTLTISGLTLLRRFARPTEALDEGFMLTTAGGTLWVASFDRQCGHQGLSCPFQDGHAVLAIKLTGSELCDASAGGAVEEVEF